MSKIEVNTVAPQCGTTLTLGESGDTVQLGSGASQSGFGRSGAVDWQTTPKTATFTAANGEGYFINQGSAITMNLPAGSAGAIVAVSDYARNFSTYNLTVSPNGSEKIGGVAADAILTVNGQAATFVYVDSTKGWVNVQNAEDTETGNEFIVATGGTITTCGNDTIHTFTGPGTFTVSQVHPCAANNLVSYVVVGGGGAGGTDYSATSGGGGGAGGYRETKSPVTPYTASPLCGHGTPGNRITVTATAFPITVGAGATAIALGPSPSGPSFSSGSNSQFSTIISAGGGGGASNRESSPSPSRIAGSGGSGGGASFYRPSCNGSGNNPPVTPAQGTNGGTAGTPPAYSSGGGGGAGAVGGNGSSSKGGDGGAGVSSEITGSSVTRSGGGGGASWEDGPASSHGAGGSGGGGAGGPDGGNAGVAGTTNTGGGGGGASGASGEGNLGGNGGSGIVIIRYKSQ